MKEIQFNQKTRGAAASSVGHAQAGELLYGDAHLLYGNLERIPREGIVHNTADMISEKRNLEAWADRRARNDEPFAANMNALHFINLRLNVVDVDRQRRGLRIGKLC